MQLEDYFDFIVNQIHTVIISTVDDDGLPVTNAIDIMYYDDGGLYFLTAKGKNFYERLKKRKFLALTGIKGKDTMSRTAVSVRGEVQELGADMLPILFERNPYMYEIYPTERSREALSVFKIHKGSGEWFDLSKKPIERAVFSFNAPLKKQDKYCITDKCIGCCNCVSACPQNCIDTTKIPFEIRQENCLHCGNCFEICPQNSVIRKE